MATYLGKFGVADHASRNNGSRFVATENAARFQFIQKWPHLPCIG
jgi:hypothetical protein